MPRLENWSIITAPDNPYQAPEQRVCRLMGLAYDDPRFLTGEPITTSGIVAARGRYVVTNSGTEYELGLIDPNYERPYPNALDRLFAALTKED